VSERVPFFDPARSYAALRSELRATFDEVMTSGRIMLGPNVRAFERELAEAVGARHAVGVASGTDAIEVALRALELPPGSEVACPNLSPPATATAILRAGHRPVLVDVDEENLSLDPEQAAEAGAAAILAVHLYGRPAAVEALAGLDAVLVEDGAQAHGLEPPGGRIGAHAAVACYSFYPTKNVGAFGDAGAVTTDDPELAARARSLRVYGEEERHRAARIGLNSRLDELQAAFLRVRLERLAPDNARRAEIAALYDDALGRASPPGVHHAYVVRSPERDGLRAFLLDEGIETAIHYPWALSEQAAFADARRVGALAVSERATREVVSLPCNPYVRDDEVSRVAEALRAAAGRFGVR
jgi:dTDP-4-amino-4,6-dideoxygalactose transaminase